MLACCCCPRTTTVTRTAIEAAIVGARHCQRHELGCSQAVPHMCMERLVTPQPYRTCQQGFHTCQLRYSQLRVI